MKTFSFPCRNGKSLDRSSVKTVRRNGGTTATRNTLQIAVLDLPVTDENEQCERKNSDDNQCHNNDQNGFIKYEEISGSVAQQRTASRMQKRRNKFAIKAAADRNDPSDRKAGAYNRPRC